MSTLADLLDEHAELPDGAVEHLQRVVAEWQLLADLSFADFLLWIPVTRGAASSNARDPFLCIAQVRPTTAPTGHPEDVVGTVIDSTEHPQLRRTLNESRICREEDPQWNQGVPVRRETIPVSCGPPAAGPPAPVIAVLSKDANLAVPRVPSQLEICYLGSAGDLCQMIADGTFPWPEPSADLHTSPRVGDGLIRLGSTGEVLFASPNAASAYHRMGHAADLTGSRLAPLTRKLIADPLDAAEVVQRISGVLKGKPSTRFEAESRRGAVVLFRVLPLLPAGKPTGALVLVRDVTEVKRRDRELLSKDAMIREIHHRVKNNLQTVAALLRLQSRRLTSPEARQALTESVRRVTSIAIVHETLSGSVDEQVDMDEVLDRVLPMLGEVSTTETKVAVRREGRFGVVPAEVATPLVMVLAELVQNAFEHAYQPENAEEVRVCAERSAKWLTIKVIDRGRGLPADFSLEHTDRLGLHIVRILAESELRGSLSLQRGESGGTVAALRVPLRRSR